MIYYLFGLLLVAFSPSLSYCWWALLLLPGLWFNPIRLPLGALLLGILVGSVYGYWQLQHRLPLRLHNAEVVLTGQVSSLPEFGASTLRYTLNLHHVESDDPALNRLRRIRVSHFNAASGAEPITIQAGDEVTLRVRLRAPHFAQNPFAFDLERYFLSSGWDASGRVRELLAQSSNPHTFYAYRGEVKAFLTGHFSAEVSQWLLPALVLGDRSAMSQEIWQVLQRTGTAHLLVVSGLHIAVVSGAGFIFGRCLILLLMSLHINAPLLRSIPLITAFIAATLYAFMAGFNLPVQRAWLMVTVFLLGEWRLLRLSGWQRWRIALVVVASHHPLAVIEAGAWMSFVAVAVLLLMSDLYHAEFKNKMALLWRAQWVIFIGLMPVMAWVFQQLGLIAPLVNLLVIPVFSWWVMLLPLLLLFVTLELPFIGKGVDALLEMFWRALTAAAQFDWALLPLQQPSGLLLLIILPLLAVLIMPLPWRWRAIGLFSVLPLIHPVPATLAQGRFNVIIFDVGQGLAVLIQTKEHLVMYDTGPGYPGGGSAWNSAIAPWFKAYRSGRLTHLIVSHNDLDHAGGLTDLFHQLDVQHKDSGSLTLIERGFSSCHQQQSWSYDQVSFRYLTDQPGQFTSENERSCVLEVSNGVCSLLLPGDAGHPTEYDLIRSGRLSPVDWLVAGHHGSKSSSSEVFITYLNPSAVIYTAGFANRYGHPAAEVTQRFQQREIAEFNTAIEGAIFLHASHDKCQIATQRTRQRRYWTST